MNDSINSNPEFTLVGIKNEQILEKCLPGDLAMWFFILAELTVFAILFIGFAVSEQLNAEMFIEGKAKLHQISGLINTLTLITSSFFVALALNAMHKGDGKKSAKLLVIAKLVASVYIAVKVWEYMSLFDQNIDIETNTFFTLYFMITFFHLMHVLLGMVILIFIAMKAANNEYNASNISGYESGASYWHMVDMLWIILFPLIYVI
ncbi:cytochrome c oxidase subunit 3 family protein [Candidatus Colwellia aromaticivorans]|uniref:cytochrome c oxidase subunit 3 family protein n=1 Tax=Candidatus Colwellia aromaticivorans TaxID=2267621 RepID=UPI001FE52CB0|nr:cytochrome c oxidase subunit 3 family protein [Candidatus Colwellia aromaticivorans]